jgi:hypothetical protein
MQEKFKFPSSPFLNPSFRFLSSKQLPSTKSPLSIIYLSSNHSNYTSPLFVFYIISKKITRKSHKSSPSLMASSHRPKEEKMGIYIVLSFKFAH